MTPMTSSAFVRRLRHSVILSPTTRGQCGLLSAACSAKFFLCASFLQLWHSNGANKVYFTWVGADKYCASVAFTDTAANYRSTWAEYDINEIVAGKTKNKSAKRITFLALHVHMMCIYIRREVEVRARCSLHLRHSYSFALMQRYIPNLVTPYYKVHKILLC